MLKNEGRRVFLVKKLANRMLNVVPLHHQTLTP